MKKLFLLLLIVNLTNCNPTDCFESTGKITQKEIVLDNFDKIEVGNEVSLIIQQGTTQKVIIETGENLIENVTVEVLEGKLYMKDESACNLTREYAVTKIYVTSPNINEIRSNTSRTITSNGILNYNNLALVSEDYSKEALNIGEFKLNVNSQSVKITANGNSLFYIKGNTLNLTIGFYSGDSRFIGNELIAQNITITQKSTNDILIHPTTKLEGIIYSIGDVIAYNHPPIVNVEELYTGELIFK